MSAPEFYFLSDQQKALLSSTASLVANLAVPVTSEHKFFALFDGTGNSVDTATLYPDEQPTLIGRLSKELPLAVADSLVHVHYVEGVDAEWTGSLINGEGCIEHAEAMYVSFVNYCNANPNDPVYLDVAGFSRGAATARHFMNLVDQRGVKAADGSCLYAPGEIRMSALLLDTVSTGQEDKLSLGIPASVDSVLHLVSADERRPLFELTSILPSYGDSSDPRLHELYLPGVHNDIGGGWESFAALGAELVAREYLAKLGIGSAGALSPTTLLQAASADATWWTYLNNLSDAPHLPEVVPHDPRIVMMYMNGVLTPQFATTEDGVHDITWKNAVLSTERRAEIQTMYEHANDYADLMLSGGSWQFGRLGRTVEGTAGDDRLYGWGASVLSGGFGYDRYYLQGGERVEDADRLAELHIPHDATGVSFTRDNLDLIITWNDITLISTRVSSWLSDDGKGFIPQINVFADSGARPSAQTQTWNAEAITKSMLTVVGTATSDELNGVKGYANTLIGLAGDDTLFATGQGDTLNGGAGDDYLIATTPSPRHTFIFGDQSETDTLTLVNSHVAKVDELKLVGGYTEEALSFTVESDKSGEFLNLVITLGDTGAKFIVQDYLNIMGAPGNTMIDGVIFDDGSWLPKTEILARISSFIQGTVNNDQNLHGDGQATKIFGLSGNDTLTGTALAEVLEGGAGNDILNGREGRDTLIGGPGDDTLGTSDRLDTGFYYNGFNGPGYGSPGAGNVYIGGPGTDVSNGTALADLYLFNLGDGRDTIREIDIGNLSVGQVDVLRFGAGITGTDIDVVRDGLNLRLQHHNGSDSVTILDWYFNPAGTENQIERIEFADGTVWLATEVTAKGLVVNGTSASEQLSGLFGYQNTLRGFGGNDTLMGNNLADTLEGGAGDDVLNGREGADTLLGGLGNDTLGTGDRLDTGYYYVGANGPGYGSPGAGNVYIGGPGADLLNGTALADLYLFNLGDGQDTISEIDIGALSVGQVDVLRFGTEITVSAMQALRDGANLVLRHQNGLDSVTVKDWFSGGYQIEQVQFQDGTVWSSEYLTTNAVTLVGQPSSYSGGAPEYLVV